MTLTLTRLDGTTVSYVVPSASQAVAYSKATHGSQVDRIERKIVTGGLPMVWPLLQ